MIKMPPVEGERYFRVCWWQSELDLLSRPCMNVVRIFMYTAHFFLQSKDSHNSRTKCENDFIFISKLL